MIRIVARWSGAAQKSRDEEPRLTAVGENPAWIVRSRPEFLVGGCTGLVSP